MKCEDCIHYDVCKNHKDCKHFSPSAQWLYSVYPIGTEVYEVCKRSREKIINIKGKRYLTYIDEYVVEKYKWDWVNASCYAERRYNRIFDNIDDARRCRDKLNEELREENKDV